MMRFCRIRHNLKFTLGILIQFGHMIRWYHIREIYLLFLILRNNSSNWMNSIFSYFKSRNKIIGSSNSPVASAAHITFKIELSHMINIFKGRYERKTENYTDPVRWLAKHKNIPHEL